MLKFTSFKPKCNTAMGKTRWIKKTQEEQSFRKSRSGGVLAIEPTERCSLVNFIKDLRVSQYEIVDAFYKQGIDTRDTRIKRKTTQW